MTAAKSSPPVSAVGAATGANALLLGELTAAVAVTSADPPGCGAGGVTAAHSAATTLDPAGGVAGTVKVSLAEPRRRVSFHCVAPPVPISVRV